MRAWIAWFVAAAALTLAVVMGIAYTAAPRHKTVTVTRTVRIILPAKASIDQVRHVFSRSKVKGSQESLLYKRLYGCNFYSDGKNSKDTKFTWYVEFCSQILPVVGVGNSPAS